LDRSGFIGDVGPAVEETVELLGREAGRYGPESPEARNPAKQLARRLFSKLPVVYGSEGITGLAAFRFRCQINENSKSPGKANTLPELDHNEIMGWQELEEMTRRSRLIFLRDKEEHPQTKKRIEATRDLIIDRFEGGDEFWSSGESKLARLFSLIYLGDFTSAYLALLYGVDPGPVERIESLKKRLVS
jgi:glucose/mannose-6-phosphate isomerase